MTDKIYRATLEDWINMPALEFTGGSIGVTYEHNQNELINSEEAKQQIEAAYKINDLEAEKRSLDELSDYTSSLVSKEEFAKSNVGKELMGLLFPDGDRLW